VITKLLVLGIKVKLFEEWLQDERMRLNPINNKNRFLILLKFFIILDLMENKYLKK
jgi:hypothetical protein